MQVYEVGKLYSQTRRQWDEAVDFNWRGDAWEMRMMIRGLKPQEIDAVRAGKIEIALVEHDPALFLLYQIEGFGPWSDQPYSWHLQNEHLTDAGLPPELPNPESRYNLWIFLIEASNGILQAMRLVSLSPEFSRALRDAVIRQSQDTWVGSGAYQRPLEQTYRQFPKSEQMLPLATALCEGGN